MSTQPIDPNLLPQVTQSGGQLGLLKLLQQESAVPEIKMPEPRSLGQGLAQGGVQFAQNFVQARRTQDIKKLVEQQLTAQRDQQLAQKDLVEKTAQELKQLGYPDAIAHQAATSASQTAEAWKIFQENQRKVEEANAKAEKDQKDWQSNHDAAYSRLGGYEVEKRLREFQSIDPSQATDQGLLMQTVNQLQHQLDIINSDSQAAANNPTVFANIFGREQTRTNPLPAETEANVSARLDNAGKVIGNTQSAFNLGQAQKYTDQKNQVGLLSDINNLNRGYQGLTQDQVGTANSLKKQAIMADPTLSPYQKATQINLIDGGGSLLGKNLNDPAANALNDATKQAGSISINPASGGYQKQLPQPNFLGINTAPPQFVPVPGNPANPLQDTGIQPPMQYNLGGGNPAPPPVVMPNVGRTVVIPNMTKPPAPVMTPQQQGEAARSQLLNNVGQTGYGLVKDLGNAAVNTGGAIQGFTGLPFNPLDWFGGGQASLNRLK